jgi:hypothetical protein
MTIRLVLFCSIEGVVARRFDDGAGCSACGWGKERIPYSRAAAASPGDIKTPRQELADGELPVFSGLRACFSKGLCSRAGERSGVGPKAWAVSLEDAANRPRRGEACLGGAPRGARTLATGCRPTNWLASLGAPPPHVLRDTKRRRLTRGRKEHGR